MPPQSDPTGLLQRAQAGDDVALTLLLTASRPLLITRVRRRIPPDLSQLIDAEDVVQDAHTEVFRHLGAFDARDESAFERWVSTIAIRKLRDQIRQQRTAKRGGAHRRASRPANVEESMVALVELLAANPRTPSRSVARIEAVGAVQAALEHIPDHYRKAVWIVHIEGRPVGEAASALGCTERAVHGYLRRGLSALREQLGDASRFFSSSGG